MSQITSPQYRKAFILVTTLFFMWGLSYGLIDVLNKHFQVTLNVSKAQSGLIQAAYFGAYFVVAIPAGLFMEWKGYKAGILCGLSLYAIGALLFVPAAGVASFTFFLFALFVIALGLGCLETAANSYSSALGSTETAETRLNLSQSFNGLGQFTGPLLGGLLFFGGDEASGGGGLDAVRMTYVGIACVVILLVNGNVGTGVAVAGAFSLVRFRSVPGNARDIVSIFFAMAVGLATGMGYLFYALLFLVIIGVVNVALLCSRFGDGKANVRTLKITVPENLDYEGLFDDLLQQYATSYTLEKVRTTNMGSLFELSYTVRLKGDMPPKAFLDALNNYINEVGK